MINSRRSKNIASYIKLMKDFLFTEDQFDRIIYKTRIVTKKRINQFKIETYLCITNPGKSIIDKLYRVEMYLESGYVKVYGVNGSISLSTNLKDLKDKLHKACESCDVTFMLMKIYQDDVL